LNVQIGLVRACERRGYKVREGTSIDRSRIAEDSVEDRVNVVLARAHTLQHPGVVEFLTQTNRIGQERLVQSHDAYRKICSGVDLQERRDVERDTEVLDTRRSRPGHRDPGSSHEWGGLEQRDPVEDFHNINRELAEYSEVLAQRPQIVAVNKLDLPETQENLERVRAAVSEVGFDLYPISAATGQGLDKLLLAVGTAVAELPPTGPEIAPEDRVVYTLPE
jgi:hypothetical protein